MPTLTEFSRSPLSLFLHTAFAIFIFLAAMPGCAHAAQNTLLLGKGLAHYARDMEFYYQNPRPEVLPYMLANFASGGVLAHAENRLMLAAFLGELARSGGARLDSLESVARQSGKPGVETLAWAAHLANGEAGRALLNRLLAEIEPTLARQIRGAPAPLAAWNAAAEPSIVQMLWAAFMATGNPRWIDDIIAVAREWAENRARGRHGAPSGSLAAASLYEYAPRHPLVLARIKSFYDASSGAEREMLKIILDNNGG